VRKQGSEKRSTDEIVADILHEVGARPGSDIEDVVRGLADNLSLLAFKPPRAGFQKDNIQYAEGILDWIDASRDFSWGDYRRERRGADQPPAAEASVVFDQSSGKTRMIHTIKWDREGPQEWVLQGDELKRWLETTGSVFFEMPWFAYLIMWAPEDVAALDQEGIEALDEKSFNAAFEEAQKGEAAFLSALSKLSERSRRILELRLGEHGSARYDQVRAAAVARELMERCGLPLAYTSTTSAYRVVASLFYEDMTGEYDKDLERACEKVARRPAIRTEKVGRR
jgi:hypothetical protein